MTASINTQFKDCKGDYGKNDCNAMETENLNNDHIANFGDAELKTGAVGGVLPSKLKFEGSNKICKEKRKKIEKILSSVPIDTGLLKKSAISEGGLIDDDLRKKAWPLLLGLTDLNSPPAPSRETLLNHPEYQQVVLDVNRSLKRFPPGIPLEQRLSLQDQLTRLILRVVIAHPRLSYYQGYHDVAVTLLLVTGENAAFFLLEHLSNNHLKDCMEPTMEKTSHMLTYIYPLVRHQNPAVFERLEKSGVGTMFALPWVLTWFGHSLNQYEDVVRLYDFFLASEPLAPLYLSSVIVTHQAKEILKTSCDMASMHSLLSHIPEDLPFESLLKKSAELYKKYPPNKIESEVVKMIEKEQRQRQMELALRQQQMARNASLLWRWLHHMDPVRRIPFWVFPQPRHIPWALRRYPYLMATAFAVGFAAIYMKGIEAAGR